MPNQSEELFRHPTLGEIFSIICGLCMVSDFHKNIRIKIMGTLFLPPLQLDQFRIWYDDNGPTGFVVWAFLSKEVAERYKNGTPIQPDEWQSGKDLWFINFVSIRGSLKEKIRGLYGLFPNYKIGHILRRRNGRVGKYERLRNVVG
jgi:cytolysin-activating lysine-acyltransferase|tara:strand:+ start:821 stop:1258 length:438 start_codon:yes stop_codon:yes gene_type:complete